MKGKLKVLKPINSSSRNVVLVDKSDLWKGKFMKRLSSPLKKTGGRNNRGVITCRHQGGGERKIYRQIDFKRMQDNIPAVVERIEYDPNRTGFIALIKYETGEYSYILAPAELKVGDTVISGVKTDILPGNCCVLENIPIGTQIHNVELMPGSGGKMARGAGAYAQLAGKENGWAILKMPSTEIRKVSLSCRASIGIVSNQDKFNEYLGKAGRNRWLGIRPEVRGVAMNPVSHHNGGRTSGGKSLASRNGKMKRGLKTRKPKSSDFKIISRRVKKSRR